MSNYEWGARGRDVRKKVTLSFSPAEFEQVQRLVKGEEDRIRKERGWCYGQPSLSETLRNVALRAAAGASPRARARGGRR